LHRVTMVCTRSRASNQAPTDPGPPPPSSEIPKRKVQPRKTRQAAVVEDASSDSGYQEELPVAGPEPAGTLGIATQDPGSGKAVWNAAETRGVFDGLLDLKAESGDGANFPMSTYNKIALRIAPFRRDGPPKTGSMVKRKWALVRTPCISAFDTCLTRVV
jgi:hypothetical protein